MNHYSVLIQAMEVLRGEPNLKNSSACIEQLSWILLLKFLDDLERHEPGIFNFADHAVIEPRFRWHVWARDIYSGNSHLNNQHDFAAQKIDAPHFVKGHLFPFMQSFILRYPKGTLLWNVGLAFTKIVYSITSSRTLETVLRMVDQIDCAQLSEYGELFDALTDELSRGLIDYVQPPAALVRAVVTVMAPEAGETIYDPAAGTGRFIVEAANYIQRAEQYKPRFLRRTAASYYSDERSTGALVLAVTNAVFSQLEPAYLHHRYALAEDQPPDDPPLRFDVVFSNPPFGGRVDPFYSRSFKVMTDSEELLFLQKCMGSLRQGGRAAIILPEGILSQRSGAALAIKKELLSSFNLHTILSLPAYTFSSTAVKTSVLFFDKTGPTKDTWMYECRAEEGLSKYRRLHHEHLAEFVSAFSSRRELETARKVPVSDLKVNFDFTVRTYVSRPQIQSENMAVIASRMQSNFEESLNIMRSISSMVELNNFDSLSPHVDRVPLNQLCLSMKHGCPGKAADSGNVKFIRITDIHGGKVNWEQARFIDVGNNSVESYRIDPGDILFARVGATAGKSSLVRTTPARAIFASNLIKLVVNSRLVIPEYLFLYLQSREFLDKVDKNLSGAVQLNISSTKLGSFEIPVPAIIEQHRIVGLFGEIYSDAAKLTALAEQQLIGVRDLRASLLQTLFRDT